MFNAPNWITEIFKYHKTCYRLQALYLQGRRKMVLQINKRVNLGAGRSYIAYFLWHKCHLLYQSITMQKTDSIQFYFFQYFCSCSIHHWPHQYRSGFSSSISRERDLYDSVITSGGCFIGPSTKLGGETHINVLSFVL